MRRGEIWLCDFGNPVGHEPAFIRPAAMVSADETGQHGLPMVVPFTNTQRGYVTHIEVETDSGRASYAACEQLRAVSIDRLIHKVGELTDVELLQVERVLRRLLVL